MNLYMKRYLVLLLCSILFNNLSKAQSSDLEFYALPADGMEYLSIRTFTNYDKIDVGQEFILAVHFDLEYGWYTYNSVNTGHNRPTTILIDLPKGLNIKETLWPESFEKSDGSNSTKYLFI